MHRRRYQDTSWMEKAPCKGMTDLFFPRFHEMPTTTAVREARAKLICQECVYIETCRDYAIQNGEKGIWGGTSEEDRRLIPVTAYREIG